MTAKIKLNAASGGGSVSIVAPTSTTSNANVELKLPIADGSSEQVIKTDGSGNLSFGRAVTAKNLLHNGNFVVAQKGTNYLGAVGSSTSGGYNLFDRWQVNHSVQAAPTTAQADIASGTSPYTLGFRKALKITNGNQSNGAQANSIFYIRQFIESQDIATSGWNYTDPNSKITLSFWIKSSVAQSFHGHVRTQDGTAQRFPFQTGTLAANTWTKITKVIPGNANLQFDTDTRTKAADRGLDVVVCPYMGTNYTDSGATFDQWQAESSANFAGTDMATTWYTTNASTLEFTGFQLELGSSASSFAVESYAETLRKCQRYLYKVTMGINSSFVFRTFWRFSGSTGHAYSHFDLPIEMRAAPSFTQDGTTYSATGYTGDVLLQNSFINCASLKSNIATIPPDDNVYLRPNNTSGSYLNLLFLAEL
jgi:hypothetical protein